MATGPRVLIVGLQPQLIDFSSPDYAAFPGLDAAKVQAALDADEATLRSLGYDAHLCLTDFGDTAEAVVSERLTQRGSTASSLARVDEPLEDIFYCLRSS